MFLNEDLGEKRKIALQVTHIIQNAKEIFKNSILCEIFASSYSEQ